jgi:hypothetical protein
MKRRSLVRISPLVWTCQKKKKKTKQNKIKPKITTSNKSYILPTHIQNIQHTNNTKLVRTFTKTNCNIKDALKFPVTSIKIKQKSKHPIPKQICFPPRLNHNPAHPFTIRTKYLLNCLLIKINNQNNQPLLKI